MTMKTPRLQFIALAIFALFAIGFAANAQAQQAPVSLQTGAVAAPNYEVKNVVVDITSNNAVEARKQAFAEAQTKAFQRLAKQLRPELQPEEIKVPDKATLSRMVRDFEIASEHLSATRYRGNFTFRFDPIQTSIFLQMPASQTASATDALAGAIPVQGSGVIPGKLLLVPFWQSGSQFVLWGDQNPLRKSFENYRGLPLRVSLARGDSVDVANINDNQALTHDPQKLRAVANRYQAERAVIIMGTPDISYAGGGAGVIRSLTVGIYDTIGGRPSYVDQIVVPVEGQDNMDLLTNRAIQMVLPRINTLPTGAQPVAATIVAPNQPIAAPVYSGQPAAPVAAQQSINIQARFANLGQWASMQTSLRSMPDLANISVRSVGMGSAELSARIVGSINNVQTNLARAGFTLSAQSGGSYILTPSNYGQRG